MIEVKEINPEVGIFGVSSLSVKESRDEIISSVRTRGFFVLILGENREMLNKHPAIKKAHKECFTYAGIAITINGIGMANFKDTFHRSSTYVDQRMIRNEDFKEVFEDEEVTNFFDNILQEFGGYQIRGMKDMLLRKK